ncbi:hypothetical protein LZ31DRAFT_299476 [Colletotrichum somersetense]|nr:hypothetical protein LZ31DRAFT_299476 [Colletotrichum somersetense]
MRSLTKLLYSQERWPACFTNTTQEKHLDGTIGSHGRPSHAARPWLPCCAARCPFSFSPKEAHDGGGLPLGDQAHGPSQPAGPLVARRVSWQPTLHRGRPPPTASSRPSRSSNDSTWGRPGWRLLLVEHLSHTGEKASKQAKLFTSLRSLSMYG